MQIISSVNIRPRACTPHLRTIISVGGIGIVSVRLLLHGSSSYRSDVIPADDCKHFRRQYSTLKSNQRHCSSRANMINEFTMSPACQTLNSSVFRLEDYDSIGFDLDNTLCEYNIYSLIEMEYSVLANFLLKERGYDPNYLLKPLDENSIDFLQKGLFVDFARGNLLKLTENGLITKASHGTKFMSDKEIIEAYGKGRIWEVTTEFSKNLLLGWNGPNSGRVRPLLDYFDMPASLAFARIVDSLDQKLGKPADIYNIWPDVLAGFQQKMYNRENFMSDEDGFFKNIKSNPEKFIKVCKPEVVEWLKDIKRSKLTFLITGSNSDFASLTAEVGLGKNWRSLFDFIVCYARKPNFFSGCRPFIELNGFNEIDPVSGSIEFGKIYSQGNWQELYQLIAKALGKQNPNCLYFGDNLIQDVYTPSEYTKCETGAVVEELSVEGNEVQHVDVTAHLSLPVLKSKSWGSYFYDENSKMDTLWGRVIQNHVKLCVPSLSALAQYPISHEFNTFYRSERGCYFPNNPYTFTRKEKVDAI